MTPPHQASRQKRHLGPSPEPEGLREENKRLRQEIERLRQQVSKQAQKLAEEQQRIAEADKQIANLERQLGLKQQNSTTSSKPPSSDGLAGKQRERCRRKKSKREVGGQPGHPGAHNDIINIFVDLKNT